ncbi:hypothetical protein BOX15_Mlig031350g1, partial [Macrostomum lignano]
LFRTSAWLPSKDDWRLCLSCVSAEERRHVEQFLHRRDSKAALASRLLARRFGTSATGLDNSQLTACLQRSDKGRPFLAGFEADFNISHQGDVLILCGVCGPGLRVGCDVMKATLPRGESSAESFFRIMRRQLTEDEWRFVRSHGGDSQQLAAFYRIWCLKESVVKATGDGIGFSLSRLNCQPDPDFLFDAADLPLTTSRSIVYIDGSASSDWLFEEHRLPLGHVAAVAWQRRGGGAGSHVTLEAFTELAPLSSSICDGLQPITVSHDSEMSYQNFCNKPA